MILRNLALGVLGALALAARTREAAAQGTPVTPPTQPPGVTPVATPPESSPPTGTAGLTPIPGPPPEPLLLVYWLSFGIGDLELDPAATGCADCTGEPPA
ncbi:MAG TPA: hypothetical protein VH165_33735, partial [Kofleriaceae bacterium]|nr:hypothetical protein [Kofleriaceae bacterium]